VDGLGAAGAEATNPVERLVSLLKHVPSDYFSFRESLPANEAFDAMRALSDAELREAMRDARGPRLELFLCEAIRRGGKDWSRFVAGRWEAERESRLKTARGAKKDDDPWPQLAGLPSVDWLTAMRRLEGKPDPLQILVAGKRTRSCPLGRPPSLFLLLTNLDVDRSEIRFKAGGDYRSGRQARWRLEVTDPEGHVLPQRVQSGFGLGGGIYQEDTLRFGESWATELNIGSFVRIEAPGKYKIRVLYHDQATIADWNDVAGLIVSVSLPIDLTVEPVAVEATRAELDAIRKSISELPANGSVKFVEGDYDKEAYDFIKPDSPPGKLLAMGWRAVPAMIDAVLDEKAEPVRRAWLLSLLASITHVNDPRDESGVLGSCDVRESGWSVWGGTPGQWSGGLGTGTSWNFNARFPTAIEPKRQLEFAKRWAVWKQKGYVKLNLVEAEGRK
jgi:hypothetical protein